MNRKTKIAVLYRVIQEWRLPVFNRLAKDNNIDLILFHGPDFEGTKVVSSKKPKEFKAKKLFSLRFFRQKAIPFSPFLFFHLIWHRPAIIVTEGASNLFNAVSGFIYCKLFGKKYIWWSLGSLKNKKHTGFRRKLDLLINYLERRSDAIIAYSSFGREYFKDLDIPERKIFVATNVIDTESKLKEIAQTNREKIYRASHDVHDFIILYVGALDPVKKVDVLIRSYSKLEKKYGDRVQLIIVGDGIENENLKQLSRKLETQNIEFTGKVFDGVSKYFLKSDVFVLPGLGGLAVSEALVHRLPVIVGVGDGCEKDLVINGYNGIIDETLDEEKIFLYLEELILDEKKLDEMKTNALRIINEKHNISTYINQIKSAFEFVQQT